MRHIAKGDERIKTMQRVSKHLQYDEGPHLLLAYQIENQIKRRFNEGMNINGYVAAFFSDQGFSADEVYQIFSTVVMSGVTACYLDTIQKPNDSFLPLRCDDIEYLGKKQRYI